jgi:hypothetical protein
MENRKEFAAKFSEVLNSHLVMKYNKVPSGYFFANQFNLRAKGTSTITAETARKWIKGITVPEIDRFKVLIDWLNLDTSELFHDKTVHLTNKETNDVINAIETKIHDLAETIKKFKSKKIKKS